jgi:hypothetical protein
LTVGGEREAFLLWTSSSERSERERVAIRKEAISTLENAIEALGRDVAHRSLLTCTLRRWRGLVAREEGDWAAARFEFLQGRNLAESYDAANVPWFDAAITEAEIWAAFGKSGLELDALRELVEKLDNTAGLYGMAGDRSNEEFTAAWAEWFRFFLVQTTPRQTLVTRILNEVKRSQPEPLPRGGAMRTPLGGYLFEWNFFWYSALARQTEALLRGTLGAASSLEELLRGAAVLAPPAGSFEPLVEPRTFKGQGLPVPDSPEQLSGLIQSDLERFRSIEKDTNEYVSRVRLLWESATHQKRKEVEHAMHPGKQRR